MTKKEFENKLQEIESHFEEIENAKNDIFEAFFDKPGCDDDWEELSAAINSMMDYGCGCMQTSADEILRRYSTLPFTS